MKLITIGGFQGSVSGNYGLIDNEDYDLIKKYKWTINPSKNTMYARAYTTIDNKKQVILMHRLIMNVLDSKMDIDHIDHNGLNNQKSNLRIATRSQNRCNSKIKNKSISKYRGVHQLIKYKKCSYTAFCSYNNKRYIKSGISSEIEAALWYNEKAKELHGEFATLNIFETEYEKIECIRIQENNKKLETCKKCSYCKEYKTFDNFRIESKRKDKLSCSCRKCETIKTYKSKNKNEKV